jgi:acyl-CoA thioesterase-1
MINMKFLNLLEQVLLALLFSLRANRLRYFFLLLVLTISPLVNSKELTSLKVLVMGDSLSAAYNMPSESGWVNLAAEYFKSNDQQITFINASVSGATTAAGLKILPIALEQHQPNIVILELGANDGLQGKPIPYITSNLSKLIKLSQEANAKVLLLGVRIPPNYGSAYTEPFFQQYEKLSKKYDTALVPFFLEGVAGNNELMMQDGLHPKAEGQPKVLQNVIPELKVLLNAF